MSVGPHFRVLPNPPRAQVPAGSELIECASGDGFLISPALDGGVLLTVDDCDETLCPTAHLTKLEARRLALALMHYADCRRPSQSLERHDH